MNDLIYKKIIHKVNVKQHESELLSESEAFLLLAYKALEKEENQNELNLSKFDNPLFQMKLDGYDLLDESNVCLYIVDYDNDDSCVLTKESILRNIDAVKKFETLSIKDDFYRSFDEGQSVFHIAKYLYDYNPNVYIKVLTNKFITEDVQELLQQVKKDRIDIIDANKLNELDILENELLDDIEFIPANGIDFVKCKAAVLRETDELDMYLMFVNGCDLAKTYEKYGYALLEGNVRAYLKKTQKTNKGILETLSSEPEIFVSYNNGLSTIATNIEIKENKIIKIEGWKIVNGGQTTATIFEAYKAGELKNNVNVAVKLTLIKKSKNKEELVSKIAEYANTQSKVNSSDLSSNEKYFLGVERFSRSIYIPKAIKGTELEKWYFERLAGQYEVEKNKANASAFESEYPKKYKFDKKLLAKAVMSWEQEPYTVSLGGEKNFYTFNTRIRGNEGVYELNEKYYKDLMATIILFQEIAKVVDEGRYGGYKANITTYVMSLISHITTKKFNLKKIWNEQQISNELKNVIALMAKTVNIILHDTPENNTNVAMYCRKEECWEKVRSYDYGLLLPDEYILDKVVDLAKGTNDTKVGNQIIDISQVTADEWGQISKWGKTTEKLSSPERQMAYSMCKIVRNGKIASQKQIDFAKSILIKAYNNGFNYSEE